FRPDHGMSPPVDARCLSRRSSLEGHCDGAACPRGRGVVVPWSGHLASPSLLPFAPPRFAARLHRYYESSDFYRALHPPLPVSPKFASGGVRYRTTSAGPLITQCPPLPLMLTARRPRPYPDRSP